MSSLVKRWLWKVFVSYPTDILVIFYFVAICIVGFCCVPFVLAYELMLKRYAYQVIQDNEQLEYCPSGSTFHWRVRSVSVPYGKRHYSFHGDAEALTFYGAKRKIRKIVLNAVVNGQLDYGKEYRTRIVWRGKDKYFTILV